MDESRLDVLVHRIEVLERDNAVQDTRIDEINKKLDERMSKALAITLTLIISAFAAWISSWFAWVGRK
jgi:hypothetical protein